MKVGFDISQIAHAGGVGVYTQNLAERLVNLPGLQMTFFYSSLRKPYQGKLPNVKSFRLPPTVFEKLFNDVRVVPIEKFIGSIDIYHSSDWIQPPTKAKKVTTYHDVIPLKYPQWSHPKIVAVHKKRLELVEKEVDMVIAVSEATKKDLMEVSKIPAEKITIIYEAASDIFKPQEKKEVEEFRQKMKLPEKFVLAIGGIGERRNLTRVREAAGKYPLVVTGETIPRLPYEQLPLLYSCADALLYPSLYEGFGLPVLEAMRVGIPVVTSNVSSLPEVGGDAAVYVDPTDTENISQKLTEVMEDIQLRENIIAKGFIQAQKFSWEKCASQTATVYNELYGK